ncbi:holin [Mycobacterium phage DrLupo]|uniref:Holin n=1 Tax=Mycobacterium phage DrLupo TaxID=2499037 RepID=A0A3S9UQK3_9CAUD|nr:holin [Mycobacterium phage DrLupo]AZS12579.1 holin [Mycobacterium phage DrLupo]
MASEFVDKVQQAGKAVAGGVAGALVSVLFTSVTDPDAAVNPDGPGSAAVQLPNTQAEWVAFATAVIVGFLLPFLKRNFPSVLQARTQLAEAERRVAENKQVR